MDNHVEGGTWADFLDAVFILMFTSLGSVKCSALCVIWWPVNTHDMVLLWGYEATSFSPSTHEAT